MSTYSHIPNSSEGHMVDYTIELIIDGQYQN